MQGKVLSDGVIRGEDGKRYAYESSDIKSTSTPPRKQYKQNNR